MKSFWERDAMSSFDIVIVGGGILGLHTAIELADKYPTVSIAVFEKSIFSYGATTRNAGFACFGSTTEILCDRAKWGDDKALEIIEKRWQGIQAIRQRIDLAKIDFENYGGYELIFQNNDIDLTELNQFLYPIFKENVFEKIENRFGFGKVEYLIYNRFEAQLHSGKLLLALLQMLQSKGVFYFSNAEIKDYSDNNDKVHFLVHSNENTSFDFEAKKLVFCTNAFPPKDIGDIQPARGQVLITQPINQLKWKGCFHFDEGYYYFRNVGTRILFGGGRNLDFETEQTREINLNNEIQTELEAKLKEIILPQQDVQIDMQWSGIMAFSNTKLPQVTRISPNVLYAMNCNGMGVSLSPITAGEIMALL